MNVPTRTLRRLRKRARGQAYRSLLQARRRFRDPFAPETPRVLLVHGAIHKGGSVWLARVLGAVTAHYGLFLFNGSQDDLPEDADLLFESHTLIRPDELPPFRGTQMVRDPRDLVVSGYHYHLRTTEAWVREPNDDLGGLGYQEYLRSLDADAGLHAEIDRLAPDLGRWADTWDFDDPRFLHLHYEDLVADEPAVFARMFRHYGFSPAAVETSVGIASRFSLDKAKIDPRTSSHIRSGAPGEWRDVLTADHIEHVKATLGPLLVRMGYESDDSW